MKRCTETDKWRDAWYLALSPNAKVMLGYIYDNCDEAGFIDVIKTKWIPEIKLPNPAAFTSALLELQPVLLSNKSEGKLWLTIFLRQEQKLPLNPKDAADKYILEKLTRQLPKFDNAKKIQEILNSSITKKGKTKGTTDGKPFVPPTLQEFKDYFKENKFPETLAETAWKGYNEKNSAGVNWVDSEGKAIKNWKQKCQHVWFNDKNKNNGSKTHKQHDKGNRHEVVSNF